MRFSTEKLSAYPVVICKEVGDQLVDAISDTVALPINIKSSITRYSNSGSVTSNAVILTIPSTIDARRVLLAIQVSAASATTLTLVIRRLVNDANGVPLALTSTTDETYNISVSTTPTTYIYELSKISDAFQIEASALVSTSYSITGVVIK